MDFASFALAQCLSALSQAAILFFVACGLTLIFGIMRVVNFAHGVIFMLGALFILGQPFPVYRVFLIALGVVAGIGVWQFLERTRAGLLIRAVSQNPEMVHALGVDVGLVRSGVFGLGCAMAALGGVLAAPLLTAFLGMGTNIVIDAFVIVIIGGMGSFLGSIIGSILVAFVQVLGAYYFQELALSFMYFLMLIVLVIRPGGLLGMED